MSVATHMEHAHHDTHGHHEESFISKYIFSQDHKMIGKQFLMTAIFMGLVAMLLSILFRIQLAWPGESSEKISFDFDDTLTRADIQEKAKRLIESGADVYIISAS